MPAYGSPGSWGDVFPWPLIGAHAILTPDGKVLSFGTDLQGQQGAQHYFDVWDPVSGAHQTVSHTVHTDLFCSSAVIIPDTGQILIAGGDSRLSGIASNGVPDVNVFDYRTLSLAPSPEGDMAFARWYGTAVTLANGKILMLGGKDGLGAAGTATPELYTPGTGWKTLEGASSLLMLDDWFYPRAWLASDGRVVLLQTSHAAAIDPSGNGKIETIGTVPFIQDDSLPSIMFERDRVLTLDSSGDAWIIDLSRPAPAFEKTASLEEVRHWSSMTLLADGSVMVTGGSGGDNTTEGILNHVAIWSPSTGLWSLGDDAEVPRLYHSTALLLPDATVLSLGGGAPGPLINLNGEIYKPPYLFDENGGLAKWPVIINAPHSLDQGETFSIAVDDPSSISRLTLVRYGSVTHSVNPEARKVELDFTTDAQGRLHVDLPDNANVVTPGHWMLFAINERGTPSVAATMAISAGGEVFSSAAHSFMTLSGTGTLDAAPSIFSLTPNTRFQTGSAMANTRIDLKSDFTISFDFFTGGRNKGGDGLAFVLHNDPFGADAAGQGGRGLGAYGIKNGFGIEFDTANNGRRAGDVSKDHTHFFDTDAPPGQTRISRVSTLSNIEDNRWHKVDVRWDADTQKLVYFIDGKQRGSLTGDLGDKCLGGSDFAYLGFTASTSAVGNMQMIRLKAVNAIFEEKPDTGCDCTFDVAHIADHVRQIGSTTFSPSSQMFTLTPALSGQLGAVMSAERIDVTYDFTITFQAFVGDQHGTGSGMTFLLHNDTRQNFALGLGGPGFGVLGVQDGLAIAIAAPSGQGDHPSSTGDWVTLADTDTFQFRDGTTTAAPAELHDGRWHTFHVGWDAETETLHLDLDGQTLLGEQMALIEEFLGDSHLAHFGWTATTGDTPRLQQIRILDVNATFEGSPMSPALHAAGDHVHI